MKRLNGLVMGLGLVVASTVGGGAFAATRGSTSVTPMSSRASNNLRSVSTMGGGPSPALGVSGQGMAPSRLVSERINGPIMSPAGVAMGQLGSGGGERMRSSSSSPGVSSQVTAPSGVASEMARGSIMGQVRTVMGYPDSSSGGMMGR